MKTRSVAVGLAVGVEMCLVAGWVSPAVANCQLGGSFCGDPVAVECNTGLVCFPPYRTCTGCTCTTTNEGKTCLDGASQPGSVATLVVTKSVLTPGAVDLSWDASCAGAGRDYSVHEGVLGTWYSHEARLCTSAGALSATLTPLGGDRYFLVAPIQSEFTGSLGVDSGGTERPDSVFSCTDDRALAPCP